MKLLQWNVQWCRGADGRVDPARIARAARELCDPDVCCFQEVAANFASLEGSDGEDQVSLLKQYLPGYDAHFAASVDIPDGAGGRRRFGNLILSRLPVGRVLRHALPWPAQDDLPSMPRVALEAVVEAPWGPVRVTTTHLEYYSEAQRAAQVGRLRGLHAEACDHAAARASARYRAGPFAPHARPAPGILAGDLNMPPEDPALARLEEAYADAWKVAHRPAPHPPTFRVHVRAEGEAPYCCDYVLVTRDLAARVESVRVDGDCLASDHQPVIVTFRP